MSKFIILLLIIAVCTAATIFYPRHRQQQRAISVNQELNLMENTMNEARNAEPIVIQ